MYLKYSNIKGCHMTRQILNLRIAQPRSEEIAFRLQISVRIYYTSNPAYMTAKSANVTCCTALFDISHAESEVLIQNPDYKAFLHAQLGDGRGTSSMAQVENKLAIKVQRKKEREDAIMSRAEREKVRKITSTANSEVAVETLDSESAESTDNENVESDDDTMTPKYKRPRPKNIISPRALDSSDILVLKIIL